MVDGPVGVDGQRAQRLVGRFTNIAPGLVLILPRLVVAVSAGDLVTR